MESGARQSLVDGTTEDLHKMKVSEWVQIGQAGLLIRLCARTDYHDSRHTRRRVRLHGRPPFRVRASRELRVLGPERGRGY
jgi:hypothetical protein